MRILFRLVLALTLLVQIIGQASAVAAPSVIAKTQPAPVAPSQSGPGFTDSDSRLVEPGESRNIIAPLVPAATTSDLTPTAFETPGTSKPGQTVPITCTIKNQGNDDALPTWYDRVYLSTDNVWDSTDLLVTNVTHTLTLTVGSSYAVTQNVTVPWVSPGQYYLLLRADIWNNLAESDETNNVRAVPFIVGTPDLTPISFTAPTSAAGWQAIPITWTVKNQGYLDALPSWQDRIYLSSDYTYDSGDTWLATVIHGVTLTAGSSYTVTQNVVVPMVATGEYHLLLLTDMWNQVGETNETNNLQAAAIYIAPPT